MSTYQLKFLLPTQTPWNVVGASLLLSGLIDLGNNDDDSYLNDFGITVGAVSRRNGKSHRRLQTLMHPAIRKAYGSTPLSRIRNSVKNFDLSAIHTQLDLLLNDDYKVIELVFDTSAIQLIDLALIAHFLSQFIYAPKRNEFAVSYADDFNTLQFKYAERPIIIDGLNTTVYELVRLHNGVMDILGFSGAPSYDRTPIDQCVRFQLALTNTHAEASGIYETAFNTGYEILKNKPAEERAFYWLVMINKCIHAYATYLTSYEYEQDSVVIDTDLNECIALEYFCKVLLKLDVVNQCKQPITKNGKLPYVNRSSLFTCINSITYRSGIVRGFMGAEAQDIFLTYCSWLQVEVK
jgi:hypothetical protein